MPSVVKCRKTSQDTVGRFESWIINNHEKYEENTYDFVVSNVIANY